MYQSYSYSTPSTTDASQIIGSLIIFLLPFLVITILLIVSNWKIFTKAGRPGWAAIIPFYNSYVLLKIVGRPGWWLILLFIPLVNLVISLIVLLDLARSFGKSAAFGVIALWLFSIVGYPMLAFGKSQYVGPRGGPSAPMQDPPAPAAPPAAPSV